MSGKDRLLWRAVLWPLLPTRADIERAVGHDPARLQRVADQCWLLFRAMAVWGTAGWLTWLAGLAVTAALLPVGERAGLWRVGLLTTAFYGAGLVSYYPWPFRDQGRWWVRWLVLAVGAPGVAVAVMVLLGS